MVRKILFVSSIFLFGLALYCAAEETVNIRGVVLFDEYQNGDITIIIRKEVHAAPSIISQIPAPGKYSIAVPKNLGNVYIQAVSVKPGATNMTGEDPRGEFEKNPIYVGDKDINSIDIIMIKPSTKANSGVTRIYFGKTVAITGAVSFDRYKNGAITIFARSYGFKGKPDVATVTINNPGRYSLNVPEECGNIEIGAINMTDGEGDEKRMPKGYYVGNPIKIGSKNVENIDIRINP